ncbi:response regulator [Sulfitobacter aestuariivivens]|uniref:Response regulator n=1 Tax=Sulfitobacter aestuariivivens TaxID=2766981 RepID=A0A927HFB0_9RHOB|nr:response regulator [Sulfitobacter aestuariivivens]MBD3665647.1 response regulator [Sulfitobacter aestuariivivens]
MHQQLTPSTTSPTPHQAQASCLIIEDSEFDSEKMSRVLNRSLGPVQIRTATTLRSAREILGSAEVNLILLDNNLPDGLGANFAQELARNDRLATIPVIMVSDWPSPFMWEKAASAGVYYVLNKSEFDARYVFAALKAARQRRGRLN